MRSPGEVARARLEWWANSETCLISVPVRVTAGPGGRGWEAVAETEPGRTEDEELRQLAREDPCFTLRSADGSSVPVEVDPSGDVLKLREVTDGAEAQR